MSITRPNYHELLYRLFLGGIAVRYQIKFIWHIQPLGRPHASSTPHAIQVVLFSILASNESDFPFGFAIATFMNLNESGRICHCVNLLDCMCRNMNAASRSLIITEPTGGISQPLLSYSSANSLMVMRVGNRPCHARSSRRMPILATDERLRLCSSLWQKVFFSFRACTSTMAWLVSRP